ncbi:EVE domain-containing protein [Mycobacterium sp. WMMD1722]|uniref:EVE domain-containing protein n=1 Tax=Mycobacterium sp. WMMD1722 TaxID=3404117 RepID=UPI003BF4AD39
MVSLDVLGAWVIKCNPRRTPLAPMVAAGAAKPSWCVADNYRSRLMRPGQRVLFWVVAHPQRGIWGAGEVTGAVTADDGNLHVPVAVRLFGSPVTAAELATVPALAGMEVFRSPQQANPSWVSRSEFEVLEPMLPAGVTSRRCGPDRSHTG